MMDVSDLRALVVGSVRTPREVARALLALDLSFEARLIAFGAVIAGSAALATLAEIVFAFVTKIDLDTVSRPVLLMLLQAAVPAYGAWAMTFFGRMAGGQGRFADALLLMTWIELMLVIGQAAQIVIMVFFPLISVLGSLALIGLLFWLIVQFTAVLHGFTNMARVSIAVVVVFFGSGIAVASLVLALGIAPVQM